jgi:hypothetical protein
MPFTPGRDTGNFAHIGLKALNKKIDDSLKPFIEQSFRRFPKPLTRFSVPMSPQAEIRVISLTSA